MSRLKAFTVNLQNKISINDSAWEYNVTNLPRDSLADAANLVKSVSLTSTLTKQEIRLRLEDLPQNRITRQEPPHNFLLLSTADFRLTITSASGIQNAPARDSADYLSRLLTTGIVLNGIRYHFFGHSNSQLKSRSCVLYAASKDDIEKKVAALGDFTKMKTVAKMAKRLGLLFSSAQVSVDLSPDRCEDIDDVIANDYTFTDGCGMISEQFAKLLVQQSNVVYRNKRYTPSVFQIRYRGYKGVLTLTPDMPKKVRARFRQSMKKLSAVDDMSFSIVEYSKPYAFGFLNDEIVLLLHSLGISEEVLLRAQADYLDLLRKATSGEPHAIFCLVAGQSDLDLADKFLLEGFDAVRKSVQKLVKQELARLLNKRDEQRCRVMIRKSRLLYGVCEPTLQSGIEHKLRPGTCFVRVTMDGDGQARTIVNTPVLVTRNPCLHPGDMQKFMAVDVPELSHLTDCIVFPVVGKRPSADLMSGGDLDGDKFFVTWDPNLIPREIAKAALYPPVKERIAFGKITGDDRAEFFARYNNMSLGRIKNLYLKWARIEGPMSPQCQQLNRLFSQCVDGNRVRVPTDLEDPPKPTESTSPFILDVLHNAATAAIKSLLDLDYDSCPEDLLGLLACRDDIAMSEFELIQRVLQSCNKNDRPLEDFVDCFDYSKLNDQQQAWIISRFPPLQGVPSLVRNGLVQSELVSPKELQRFQLHHHNLHWKPIFTTTDHMHRFLHCVSRTLELFHKKLIVIKADERLTLMIYVPQKLEKASEAQVDASVRVFALPRSSGTGSTTYSVAPTKTNSMVYYDDGVFQLYETKRANTFVFLTRSAVDKTKFEPGTGKGDRRRQAQQAIDMGEAFECRASVALNKINSAVQRHVGRMNRSGIISAEIYAISNRDVDSMHYLDQWLEYVDTDKVLPLFEKIKQDYRIPTLSDLDRAEYPAEVSKVVFDGDLSTLLTAASTADLLQMLQLLRDTSQQTRLRLVYMAVLEADVTENNAQLFKTLFEYLPSAVHATEALFDSQLWRHCRDDMEERTTVLFQVLRELVLSANSLRAFVGRLFKRVLREMTYMTKHQVAELVELIALTISEPEYALDLLLDGLNTEASRLLVARPLEIEQYLDQLIGIAMDHIDEANAQGKPKQYTVNLQLVEMQDGEHLVKASIRIDLPFAAMKTGDHIRFLTAETPGNAPLQAPFVLDTVVVRSEQGSATFRCVHRPPSYLASCAWLYRHCGSFVTSKVMLDSVKAFYIDRETACGLYNELVDVTTNVAIAGAEDVAVHRDAKLNDSQNRALAAALQQSLLLLWGPPGTGKTQTIAVILQHLLESYPEARLLVTAPTHNAVDNILQRFLKECPSLVDTVEPLRVSTSLMKVAPALRQYTCDAMVGHDLGENSAGRRAAEARVKRSRLVFTTCIGAGLGLLRSQSFDIVLVDEASQQTEPETLVPLAKGCCRAILVGDHVQLRATVQKHAILSQFDISLFERLYTSTRATNIAKVMLDVQYRMHPEICSFSSVEFYDGRLQSAEGLELQAPPKSDFPWPSNGARKVFISCDSDEDLGNRSKSNNGQVQLCRTVCKLLSSTTAGPNDGTPPHADVAILTPYARQRELLKTAIPSVTVSSIDGFQGREADVVVFVTVRCNAHHDIGFLKDLRRLNVVMTRARSGIIIIGNKQTLIGTTADDVDAVSKAVWKKLLAQSTEVQLQEDLAS